MASKNSRANKLGHDEVRAAYKAQYPNSNKPDKPDPGAAPPGGMLALRGRHYA